LYSTTKVSAAATVAKPSTPAAPAIKRLDKCLISIKHLSIMEAKGPPQRLRCEGARNFQIGNVLKLPKSREDYSNTPLK
jgi:hypothetical protein